MAAHKPTLRRQYSIGGGGPGQARRLLQCCGCREILQGSNFTYYQFKKDDAARKRCRMCSMKVREELRVATLKKWGRVEEGAGLIRAAREGNFAQVMFDIERGEKLTQRDPLTGRTALHEACATGNVELVELLLDSGADPNERAWACREVPMHFAVHADSEDIVNMLGWYGAHADCTNKYFQVPLHYCRSPECALAVLRFTTRPGIKDKFGCTASAAAKKRGLLRVRDAIEQAVVEVVIKEQRELNKEELKQRKAEQRAEVIRESRFKHEAETNKVSKAVSDYHKWRAGREVEFKAKEFKKAEADPFQRSWRTQHEDRLAAKKAALAKAAHLKKVIMDKNRVVSVGADGREHVADRTASGAGGTSKWSKYSKKDTGWKPPVEKRTRGAGLLSLKSPLRTDSRSIMIGNVRHTL